MIKAVSRFLAVLVISFLLGFAVYEVIQNNPAITSGVFQTNNQELRRGSELASGNMHTQGSKSDVPPPENFSDSEFQGRKGNFEGGGAGNLSALMGVIRNIAIIAGVTGLATAIQWLIDRIRRRVKFHIA